MKIAPPTNDEQERLKALYDYDVLDTEAEKVFDDLTLLASEICGTPIALISLIDPDRQWFKSKLGLGADETSRDIAFCAHAIHQREVFEVKDTLKDQRFANNPLVTSEPNIRFYAGTPLITPEGYAIGTLCAIDKKPNHLSVQQRNSLEIIGRSVISQLELRKNIQQLKQASQHKTEFLSNMSHELRTPLNAIIGFSRLMQDEIEHHALPDKFNQYLDHLDFSGKRLLSVINSVLDLSKIEEGKMQLNISSIHCLSFFKGIEEMLSFAALQKALTLSILVDTSVGEHLNGDEAKLAQILLNLINNAIKFSPQGSQVKVNVLATDEHLTIAVQDFGVGISKADQMKLFNKFQQVGKAKSSEGTGLGLSITKGLVELMKGEIKLSSTEGQGSLFKVVLPIMAQVKLIDPKPTESLTLNCNKDSQILVVEDNLINQEVVKAQFAFLGLRIEIADSGEQALQMIEDKSYDLIFMDIHLPGITGIEATSLIRRSQPGLPIIGLSADAFQQHSFSLSQNATPSNQMSDYLLKPNTAPSNQMSDYLLKPINSQQLIAVLNRFIPPAKPACGQS